MLKKTRHQASEINGETERNGVWFPEDGDSRSKTGQIDNKCKVVPVHTMKEYGGGSGEGGIPPLILKLGTKQWHVVSFTPGLRTPGTPSTGDRGSTVVKVLCYKSEGRWFDPSWCHWNFSLT